MAAWHSLLPLLEELGPVHFTTRVEFPYRPGGRFYENYKAPDRKGAVGRVQSAEVAYGHPWYTNYAEMTWTVHVGGVLVCRPGSSEPLIGVGRTPAQAVKSCWSVATTRYGRAKKLRKWIEKNGGGGPYVYRWSWGNFDPEEKKWRAQGWMPYTRSECAEPKVKA